MKLHNRKLATCLRWQQIVVIGALAFACSGGFESSAEDGRQDEHDDDSESGGNGVGGQSNGSQGGSSGGTDGANAGTGGSLESGGSETGGGPASGGTDTGGLPECGSGECPYWGDFDGSNPPAKNQCVSDTWYGEYEEWVFIANAWDSNCGPHSTQTSYCWPKYGTSYVACE